MCVYTSTLKAINYIHVILSLHKQLNKFVYKHSKATMHIGVAIVTKCVMTEINLIKAVLSVTIV